MGARKPSDYGLYFQWGDIIGYTADQVGYGDGKKCFSPTTYKFSINGSQYDYNKYATVGSSLKLEDDAAHVNMGGDWHMPTPTQINELINHTTSALTTSDGVSGMTFTSKKDKSKSIFIPAAGYARNKGIENKTFTTDILSSMLSTKWVQYCQLLFANKYGVFLSDNPSERWFGYSVRGVIG